MIVYEAEIQDSEAVTIKVNKIHPPIRIPWRKNSLPLSLVNMSSTVEAEGITAAVIGYLAMTNGHTQVKV
jgi:hypothetical protein